MSAMGAAAPSPFSIFATLSREGERIALSEGGKMLTYRELDAWSSQIAARIRAWGPTADQPIGLLAPSSLEFAAALVGIWKAGALAVPLQPAHPPAELQYIVADSGLSHILVHPQCRERAEKLWAGSSVHLQAVPARAAEDALMTTAPSARDGALIVYTSGTTNRPKGVVTTFASLEAQISTLLKAWGWSAEDRTLDVLPLHHVHGLVNILSCAMAAGARCEMAAKFDPQLVWSRIANREINVFMAVPTIYSRLIQHWEAQDAGTRAEWSRQARDMRLMVSGSAALPQPVFERWLAMTGHRLLERYGMTEIGMALSNPLGGERKMRTVGAPLPGVEVRLIDESGAVLEGPELPGEIQVRGPAVFREYWRQPRATAESFTADGWFRTGDIAERDRDGYYTILGRRSQDIIKSGGYKISALEIESALLEHPLITEAAVIGMPDPEWGERVAAVFVSSEPDHPQDEELAAWLKGRVAHYKVPTLWYRDAELPRNAMGKIVKSRLRETVAAAFKRPTS